MNQLLQPKQIVGGGSGGGGSTVDFTSFGAVGNGVTDNSAAWAAFNTYARAESTAGRGVNLVIPPGTYNYDGSLSNQYFYGIKKLHVIGYGAVIQNTFDSTIHGGNSAFEWAMSPPCQPNLFSSTDPNNPIGPLIQTTAIGDTHVTLLNPAFISQFHVGDWVMVSSLDIQYFGYPPNCDNLDFVQITAINTSTNVLTFSTGLLNAHRSDFADGGNTIPCGKARVWQLNSIVTWDIDHVYEGIEVRKAINSSLTYINIAGKSWKALNCVLPGISPSIAKYVEIRGCTLTDGNEPDKLVQNLLIDGGWIKQGIQFQSSGIDCVTIRGCRVDSFLETGQTKQTLIQNCNVDGFTEGVAGPYGTARGLILDGCLIKQMPVSGLLPNPTITVDGTNTSYTNGVFKILPAGDQSKWGIALGSMINLCGQNFSGNLGTGIVTKISDQPGTPNLLVQTTLPYATLPSWVTGISLCRHANFSVHNCSGCDQIINYNKLTAQGLTLWGNFELLLTGASNRAIFDLPLDCVGNLISVTADVIQAYPNTGGAAQLQLGFTSVNATTMATSVPYNVVIDLTVAGKRVFTQTALTGAAGGDTVNYNSVTITTLQAGAWVVNFEWTYFLNTANLFPVPIVRFLLQFDTGFIRTLIPAIDLDQTVSTTVSGVAAAAGHSTVTGVSAPTGTFDPTSLFAGGETGGWWDPSDMSSMFQDTAGTTPVTATGQPVARINDKSGNGNHLLQTTAGFRPFLQASGSFKYLAFAGTSDDFISAAFTFVQPNKSVFAVQNVVYDAGSKLWDGFVANQAAVYQPVSSPTIGMYAGVVGPTTNDLTVGVDHVMTNVWNGVSSSIQVDNGTIFTGDTGTGSPAGITVGAAGGGGGPGDIRWYGGVWIGRLLTTTETNNCRTFFGAKAGLTL